MSTATMSRTDAFTKIRELEQEAVQAEKEFGDKMNSIADQLAEATSALRVSSNGVAHDDTPAPARRRGGRRPAAAAAPAPAKRNAKVRKSSGKVAPSERNYSNKMSLKEAIWEVLDRNPDDWAKVLDEFPDDAEGLQISEIKEIIEKEGKWVSSAGDISPQLQGHLYNLKKEGKVARDAPTHRYYIVEGATLDAAPKKKRGRGSKK